VDVDAETVVAAEDVAVAVDVRVDVTKMSGSPSPSSDVLSRRARLDPLRRFSSSPSL
jgi:hypothetical protein